MRPNSLEAALARPKLAVHDYSRRISKLKPKIRIIHIVEPEIIRTTVEDFQELVQRLTGKPVQSTRKKNNASSVFSQPKAAMVQESTQRMKVEVEEDEAVFSSFLEDVDGFLHDMNEFPLFSFRSSIFGEMPLC